ncbi:YwmB family TATA-box binding protein [Paenibacillus bouchesdurhonensis]|uniref:YwmB family TATA-box binding protein n=1 Tax=Paenibacillus bouchesdurhonensis TaxID=1870990 RepID=UPI0018FFFC88|nr:YwmB family TATA-box binding protein [Paenibacillus bouchesdurhonensis]
MRKLWGIIAMVIVAGAIMIKTLNGPGTTASAIAAYSSEAELSRMQLEKILAVGKSMTQGEIRGTVKWQGEWLTELSLEEAAKLLADRLGWLDRYAEQVHDREVLYAESVTEEIHGKLAILSHGDGLYYVVLRLENQTLMGLEQLAEYSVKYGEMLLAEGVRIKWNAALQGASMEADDAPILSQTGVSTSISQEGEPQAMSVTVAFDAIESSAKKRLKLHQVESFEDERTVSRSYAVEELPIRVQSAGQDISLQLALHWNTETERYDISIGSPLLTVEY